jgi:hypothetical protein
MVAYDQFILKDFKGLNNAMGNELVQPNAGRDLLNVSFDKRGNLKSGLGMIDMNLTPWPTGVKVLGMKFNNLYQKYFYIIQVSTYATFYEFASGAWTLRGHTSGNVATTGAGDLALVTDSNAPNTAALQKNVQVGDYFKYDEDDDTNWTRISAIPSDTTLTLAGNYPAGAKAAKAYTVRKHLDLVNYQVMENPTLEDYSYWTSSDQNTSYIYKWDETNGIIDVSAPTNQPTNPKSCSSFKNRLWCVKGTTAWNISTNTDAIWKFNETGNSDLPQDSIGSNHATDVTDTLASASGLLNYCRLSAAYGFFGGGYFGGYKNIIDYINLATTTQNATDTGDLTVARNILAGVADPSYGYFGGGTTGAISNVIDYITLATIVQNAIDAGDLTAARHGLAGVSGPTYGFFGGGYVAAVSNIIDYITLATTVQNAIDTGDLTTARVTPTGVSGPTYGFFGGGQVSGSVNIIDYITLATTTQNATDTGDLISIRKSMAGVNGPTYGFFCGGYGAADYVNIIEYITLATTTQNSIDTGDLTAARQLCSGVSSTAYGFIGGGGAGLGDFNIIDSINLATTTQNATNTGDLTVERYGLAGAS